jgi:capsid protein
MGIGSAFKKWFSAGPSRRTSGGTKNVPIGMSLRTGAYNQLGYHAARIASREGRTATSGSGDAHQRIDRQRLINQSREFHRDNGIYTGIIEQAVTNVIDDGYRLQMTTPDKDVNAQIEAKWRQFMENPEAKGVLTGEQVEQLVARELFICGDIGVIKLKSGQIQIVESEQIAGKKYEDNGIETDTIGRPIRYWVSPYTPYGGVDTHHAVAISPEDFLFISDPRRSSALRSVPPCESSFPMLHRINDVCNSEAQAWQVLSMMALAIIRKDGAEAGFVESIEDTGKTAGQIPQRVTELDYAMIFHGEPGEEIKGIERNIPGQNFTESLVMFMRLLGLPIGMPLELSLLDWTKSNYSQVRAMLQQAHKTFRMWQKLIRNRFHNPILRWKLDGWLAEIGYDGPVSWNWIMPTFPWLDELKEAQAWGFKVERCYSTHGHACKSLGLERDEVVAARAAEVKEAIDIAKKLKEETGVDVPWQIFAGLKYEPEAGRPGGSAPSAGAGKKPDQADDTGEDEE